MPASSDGVTVEVLRDAARIRVGDTSLRATAREIGISHPALLDFLNGSSPYASTLVKLREWHAKETNEMLRLRQENRRLRQENAELKRRLAECGKQLGERKRG